MVCERKSDWEIQSYNYVKQNVACMYYVSVLQLIKKWSRLKYTPILVNNGKRKTPAKSRIM